MAFLRTRWFRILRQFGETLLLTVLLFVFVQNVVAQPFTVKQQSMEHTLAPDEYVIVDRLTPRFTAYQRADVIVFEPPPGWRTGSSTPLVKRIIGVAEDVIEIRDGRVIRNGEPIDEWYVYEGQATDAFGTTTWTVPAGELFVLGDHRSSSSDSRVFGTITTDKVIGRVWLRYWPLSRFGVLATPPSAR